MRRKPSTTWRFCLSNPAERVQQLKSLRGAVADLVELLKHCYAVDAMWEKTDFKVGDEIGPRRTRCVT